MKHHHLKGSLVIDLKSVPVKKRDSILALNIDYIIHAKERVLVPDITDTKVAPPSIDVDPISAVSGSIEPGGGSGLANRFLQKEREKKAQLAFRRTFPEELLKDLGKKFFFVKLKIPEEKFYHFLEYCNPLGIEDLYKKGQLLEVITILDKEHTSYLKIINNSANP